MLPRWTRKEPGWKGVVREMGRVEGGGGGGGGWGWGHACAVATGVWTLPHLTCRAERSTTTDSCPNPNPLPLSFLHPLQRTLYFYRHGIRNGGLTFETGYHRSPGLIVVNLTADTLPTPPPPPTHTFKKEKKREQWVKGGAVGVSLSERTVFLWREDLTRGVHTILESG